MGSKKPRKRKADPSERYAEIKLLVAAKRDELRELHDELEALFEEQDAVRESIETAVDTLSEYL